MYLLKIFLIIVSNFAYSIVRTYSTRVIAAGLIRQVVAVSILVKICWLLSVSLAVESALGLDFIGILAYIISSTYGDYVAMKIKTESIDSWVEVLIPSNKEN